MFNSISRYEVDGLPTASKVINTTIDVVGDIIHTASNAVIGGLTFGLVDADMIYRGVHLVGAAIKWKFQREWARLTGGDPSQVKFQMADDRNFTEVIGDALKSLITGTTSAKEVVNTKKKKLYTSNGDNDITNCVSGCTINSGTGDDYIFNVEGVYGTNIDAGNDNDDIFVRGRDNTVFGGQGDDEIMLSSDGKNPAYGNQIDGGPGYDQIFIDERDISSGSKKANTVAGGEGNDRIIITQSKTPVVIRYTVDDGEDYISGYSSKDTIQIVNSNYTTTKSGDNVIIKVGSGAMTLPGAANEKLNIETVSADVPPEGISYNGNKTKITASTKFRREQINLANYEPTVKEVNASSLVNEVNITGNDLNNSIRGGKGNDTLSGEAGDDTLKGGKVNDVFIYDSDDDTITDYASGDKVSVNSAMESFGTDGDNVIIDYASGSLTIDKAIGKKITFIENGKTYVNVYSENGISNGAGTAITLASSTTTFTATGKLISIDGSAVDGQLEFVGNSKANKIFASDKDTTINGDKGNDSLWGGNGSDTFIYFSNTGTDRIFNFTDGDMLQILNADGSSGTFAKATFASNNLTLNVRSGGKIIFDGVNSSATFNINGEIYRIQDNRLIK